MKLIVILTIVFILYEMVKITMLKTFWDLNLISRRNPILITIEAMYFAYAIYLFFIGYWIVGLVILTISAITSTIMYDKVKKGDAAGKNMIIYLITDSIISLALLSAVLILELNKIL